MAVLRSTHNQFLSCFEQKLEKYHNFLYEKNVVFIAVKIAVFYIGFKSDCKRNVPHLSTVGIPGYHWSVVDVDKVQARTNGDGS